MRSGVLCLQGSSEPHLKMLARIGLDPVEVRQVEHLEGLTHLILPGGESTTIHHLLNLFGLWSLILERYRSGSLALFGTCAGAILLGRNDGQRPPRMELLDAQFARNAFGRQVDSFSDEVQLESDPQHPIHGVFIRAPRCVEVGAGVRVLGRWRGETVLVEGPRLLAATFHPELTDDPRIHEHFLAMATSNAVSENLAQLAENS